MKYFLILSGGERRTVQNRGDTGLAEGACPKCSSDPFIIGGTGVGIASDDRAYEAQGVCLSCMKSIGVIRAEVSTIFGVTEDEAVQRFCRVY